MFILLANILRRTAKKEFCLRFRELYEKNKIIKKSNISNQSFIYIIFGRIFKIDFKFEAWLRI
jgi:hypothetical protein